MMPLLVTLLITAADQVVKEWVRLQYGLGESTVVVPGFFSLTYVRNTGAAWGMFGGQTVGLAILSVVTLAALILFRRQLLDGTWPHRLALGLLAGGILGNLLDRVRIGYVTDYLDFYLGASHWPAFNIADAAICTGVGIYMLTSWRSGKPVPAAPAPVASP